MVIDRRQLLAGAGALLLTPRAKARATGAEPLIIGTRALADGRFVATGFATSGLVRFDVPLPDRAHDIAWRPGHAQAVVFARRPGRFAVVLDTHDGTRAGSFSAPAGRHFQGHGTFSPDGRLLYTTENDYEAGRGVIGVHDLGSDHGSSYRRVGEIASAGIGPHQIALMPDGETLVVANGGILTHPDMGRAKLNIPTMQPNVAFIDRATGRVRATHRLAPDLHRLGLRHLAVTRDGVVVVAGQYEGPRHETVPLVAGLRPGEALAPFNAPSAAMRSMRNYCGAVSVDTAGRVAAISAPRGGLLTAWDIENGTLLATTPMPDGCGIAPRPDQPGFVASSGHGSGIVWDPDAGAVHPLRFTPDRGGRWDNHLSVRRANAE